MRFSRLLPVAILCLCMPAIPSLAQDVLLKQIRFTGDPARPQSELLAFSGLKPGPTTQQAVQDVAQRFGDTGFYDDVTFEATGSILTYTLKPAAVSALLPVRFGNFVWWEDKDLIASLQGKVPLYHGGPLPLSGNTRDAVATVLQSVVAEKGVPDPRVISLPTESRPGGPVDTITFTIGSPWVLIHGLALQQASPAMQPKLSRVIADLIGQQWDKTTALDNISSRIGDVYRGDGYLDIAVTKLDRSAPTHAANSINIDLTATLSEGPQYHVARLDFVGCEFLSAEDFAKSSPLKPGDPASPFALRSALHLIAVAYSTRGYIDANVTAPPQIDRAAHLVTYAVAIEPGPQYHLRSVQWTGLTDDQLKALQPAWRMNGGDIYDATYAIQFIRQHPQLHLGNYKLGLSEQKNAIDHTVNLTLAFTPTTPPPPQ